MGLSLIGKVSLDASGAQLAFKDIEKMAGTMGDNVNRIIGTKLKQLFSAAAIGALFNNTLSRAESIRQLAVQTGRTVEEVQRLQDAARTTGYSFDELNSRFTIGDERLKAYARSAHLSADAINDLVRAHNQWTDIKYKAESNLGATIAGVDDLMMQKALAKRAGDRADLLEKERDRRRALRAKGIDPGEIDIMSVYGSKAPNNSELALSAGNTSPSRSLIPGKFNTGVYGPANALQRVGAYNPGMRLMTEQEKTNAQLVKANTYLQGIMAELKINPNLIMVR